MNVKFLSTLTLSLLVVLSACGTTPAPTMNAADIQNTAIAQAWAAVTLTQLAAPTFTPTLVPPTETPIPTILAFPTLPPLQPTIAVGSPTADRCNDVAPQKPNGVTVQVKFVNKSEAPVDLHFGLNSPNALGECGIYYFSLGKYDQPVVTVLAGCYWAYAYIKGSKSSNAKSVEILCVTDPAAERSIWIGAEAINFH